MQPNELGALMDAVRDEMRLLEDGRAESRTGQLLLGSVFSSLLALPPSPIVDLAVGMEAGRAGDLGVEYNRAGPSMLGTVDAAAMLGFLQGVTFALALDRVRARGWFGEA